MTAIHASSTINYIAPTASLAALQALVQDDLALVNQRILDAIDSHVPLIQQLASHIIASGGKRLRPSLTLACSKLYNYEGTRHIELATCIEFIHTATLLHDDVVDKSTMRRGNATANEVWGNKASVLVGDFLLSRAFQMMVTDGSLTVLKLLSDASAIIAQGEVKQIITAEDLTTTQDDYLDVIHDKTASLFAAACALGGVVSEQEDKIIELLYNFGKHLGMAFQLVDDALDYSAQPAELGKAVGDDFRDGKITLPVLLAYNAGDITEQHFWQRTLEEKDQNDEDLAQALTYITKHDTLSATLALAESYIEQAKNSIADAPDNPSKAALTDALYFCVQRGY